MVEQIGDLKRMIRELKLERIKHESMIEELEKKEKEKEKQRDLNSLLNSKLDQKGSDSSKLPAIRMPTQKREKTEPQEEGMSQQKSSPEPQKSKKNKKNLEIEIEDDNGEK